MEADKSEDEKPALEKDEEMQDPEELKDSPKKPKIGSDCEEKQHEDSIKLLARESDDEEDEQEQPHKSLHATDEPGNEEHDYGGNEEADEQPHHRREPVREKIRKDFHQISFREDTRLRRTQIHLLQQSPGSTINVIS